MIYTEQDVLKKLDKIINKYCYYTSQVNNTSCLTTSYIVIKENNNILGCIGISKNVIKHLRVVDSYQKQGIGKILLRKAEDILIIRGYNIAEAYTHIDNDIAQKFFYKYQYLPIACGDYYYILQKELK